MTDSEEPSGMIEPPDAGQPETPQQDQQDRLDHGNREAAKYRKRLRDTEAERDRLADQLATARRSIINNALGGMKAHVHPDLFWSYAKDDVDAFFTENGDLDEGRISVIVERFSQWGAAQVRGWRTNEGRSYPQPTITARDQATRVIMGHDRND